MATRSDIFSKLVRDFTRTDALTLTPETRIGDVVGRMATEKHSAGVVIDPASQVLGILTEQDIVRRVAHRAEADQPCADIMSLPVEAIGEDEYLYFAVARMRRLGFRHMPVVAADGRFVGILDLNDAIAHAAGSLMGQIDDLTREDSIDGYREIKAVQVGLAEQLLTEGMPVTEIQTLLTHINNDIYRRIVDKAVRAMEAEGNGPAPAKFEVIVMGSGGRGENYVHPDQDNGFIIDDYPDDAHTEIDAWFIDLAERMTRDLDIAGLPLCLGFVMATNPLWRKRRSEWRRQTEIWPQKRNSAVLRHCDIFFDFCGVHGDHGFATELRAHITALAKGNGRFLREMCTREAPQSALGWFGRFNAIKDPPEYRGYLNLKHMGTLPLVSGVRLFALREGIEIGSTLERMTALHQQGTFNADDHDELSSAYTLLAELLLNQQIADFSNGRRVTNFVHPNSLTKHRRQLMKQAFKAINAFGERVRFEFAGEVY